MLAPYATAQRRGGAVSTGVRGAMVGGLVGGSGGAATGAKIGVVTGAARSSAQRIEQRNAVNAETQARAQYQTTAEYQDASHSNFNEAPLDVLEGTSAGASSTKPAGDEDVETVLRKNGKPVVGITYPSDWKQKAKDDSVSAVSKDGHAWSAIALLADVKDQDAGIGKIKQGLEKSLKDIEYDEATKKEKGGLVVTGTGKVKKSAVEVVFAIGVIESGPGQFVGAAFVVDKDVEDKYKEAVRYICQTVRRADEFTQKADAPAAKSAAKK
jgi:hypothetical protein